MLRKVGNWAVQLAHKHPLLDAAIVAVGAIAIGEAVLHIVKPKPSTEQSTGTGG
jgi:hypothetical protein